MPVTEGMAENGGSWSIGQIIPNHGACNKLWVKPS
jgi:hypothetical protein